MEGSNGNIHTVSSSYHRPSPSKRTGMSSPLQPSHHGKYATTSPTVTTYTINTATIDVVLYYSAADVLREVGHALYNREREANALLPRLEKLAHQQRKDNPHTAAQSTKSDGHSASWTPDFWLVVRSAPAAGNERTIDLILSCTNGLMGAYPIFIWAARPVRSMAKDFLQARLNVLAKQLLSSLTSPKRVFSIFGKSFSPIG